MLVGFQLSFREERRNRLRQVCIHWRNRVLLLDCDVPCFVLVSLSLHVCVTVPARVCFVIRCLRVSIYAGRGQELVCVLETALRHVYLA